MKRKYRDGVTQDRLKELLRYDPDTGVFTWKAKASKNTIIGSKAGYKNNLGYVMIGVDGNQYLAHRLAWLYMIGAWPENEIDHIGGKRDDNCWNKLRHVTASINHQNLRAAKSHNQTGFLGVHPNGLGFAAQIRVNGNVVHLGTFSAPAIAHSAYLEAKRKLHSGCTI